MKTTKQVIDGSGIPAKLIRAVVCQIGDKESLRDVAEHGADAGYCGFTYCKDTVAFFKRNRADIVKFTVDEAADLGEVPVEMVASFGCLGGKQMKRNGNLYGEEARRATLANQKVLAEYYPSVSRCLYGGRLTDDDTDVANALAWFALEEVARAFCDE